MPLLIDDVRAFGHGFPVTQNPFCCSCKVPVERFVVRVENTANRVIIISECHGKTEGLVLSAAQAAGSDIILAFGTAGSRAHNMVNDFRR